MKASEVFLTDLDALIASDQETGGKPVLPEGSRKRVEDALGLMIIWPEALQRHIRELLNRLGGNARRWELLPEETHEAIVAEGLSVLDDAALAALAINPIALCAAHGWWYSLMDQLPSAWNDAVQRRSDIQLEEKGLGWLNRMLKLAYKNGPSVRDQQ